MSLKITPIHMSFGPRILGITALPNSRGQLALQYGGRRVAITCSHMSLDIIRVEKLLRNEYVHEVMMTLRSDVVVLGGAHCTC